MVPALMACDFWVPAVPEQGRLLPSHEVHGHPQEVVWRLRNFRTAKLPLRLFFGSRVGEQYVVDTAVLSTTSHSNCCATDTNRPL